VNKLLIEFMGGGACFSATTCSLPEWIPLESANAMKLFLETKPGLHNPKQETADWHAIYIPYCTGDGHVGNNTAHYVDQTVHHMGGINAQAALSYAFEHFPDVEATLTAGQSAGAVATYMWSVYVMDHYPNADHAMLADSYVPLFGKVFSLSLSLTRMSSPTHPPTHTGKTGVTDGLKNWKMSDFFPRDIISANYTKWMSYFPGWAASFATVAFNHFPKSRYGIYASNADSVESSFYVVEGCGIEGCSWKKAMRVVMPWLRNNSTNVYTYIGTGMSHTQTVDNAEYSMKSDGVLLSDWINDLITGSPNLQKEVDCDPHCGWF